MARGNAGGRCETTSITSHFGWGVLIAAALAVGAFGGKAVSSILAKRQEGARLAHRLELQKQILGQMKTFKLGDTLVDHEFDDIDGRTIRLSSVVRASGGAIIGIISPECSVCAEEVSGLAKLVPDSAFRSRILFISSGNVEELENLRRLSGLTNLFLCDRNAAWLSQYKVHTFPFNVFVDRNLVVREIIPSSLTEPDLEAFQSGAVATN